MIDQNSPGTPTIRPAVAADAVAMVAIYNPYVQNTTVSFETQPVDADTLRKRWQAVTEAGLPWCVAASVDGVQGYAYASPWRLRHAYRYSVEVSVYLHRDHTGKGLGKVLYKQLFDDLATAGKQAIMAGISLPNDASVALHESMGMSKVAHFRRVGYKFDRWVDVGYWQAVLGPSGTYGPATSGTLNG